MNWKNICITVHCTIYLKIASQWNMHIYGYGFSWRCHSRSSSSSDDIPEIWHLKHICLSISSLRRRLVDNNTQGFISQIANFMGPTWGPPGSCRPQMGPMLAPWLLLSGIYVCTQNTLSLRHLKSSIEIDDIHEVLWCIAQFHSSIDNW